MSSLHFISKTQFEGVYDHFKQVEEKTDANTEELRIEYRLLLRYFRSLHEDGEKKKNKIMHLKAEITNCKEKFKETEKQKEKEKEELIQKLVEMKRALENQRKGQFKLIQLNVELRENIENLKGKKSNDSKKSKSDIFINRRQTVPQRRPIKVREIAVGSSKTLQSSKSTKKEKDHKKERIDKYSTEEIEFMERKYKDEIRRLQNQVKIISAETKLFRSEAASLKLSIENKNKRFFELKQQLSEEKEFERKEKENFQMKNSSLQIMIDNFMNDLEIVKDEKRLLEEDVKNSSEERYMMLLQIQEKCKFTENLKDNIDSLTKSKKSAVKRACVFEENLTLDREQLIMAKKDMDELNKTINKLQIELKERESQLNLQIDMRKRLETSQKSELLEQMKLIEYYKTQLAIADRRIKSLVEELKQSNEKLCSCRRELRNKKRENALLSEEFQKWKKNLGINTENMKSLKTKLDSAETSKSELKNELKFTKTQYFSVLKERNKLLAKCKHLDGVIEKKEFKYELLSSRQDYLCNSLNIKNSKLEKIAKLKRLSWDK